MDDNSNAVRLQTFPALRVLFEAVGKDSQSALFDDLSGALLVHMDDAAAEIQVRRRSSLIALRRMRLMCCARTAQECALANLKSIGTFDAAKMLEKVQQARPKHRTPEFCDALIRHINGSAQP